MDRRDFIRTTGTLLAGAGLAPHALGESSAANTAGGRLILPINRGWRFSPKQTEGGHDKNFDDSAFDRIVIPHAACIGRSGATREDRQEQDLRIGSSL